MAETSVRSESNPLMMNTPTHHNNSQTAASTSAGRAIQLPPSPATNQHAQQQLLTPSPANYLPTGHYNPKHHYVFKPIEETVNNNIIISTPTESASNNNSSIQAEPQNMNNTNNNINSTTEPSNNSSTNSNSTTGPVSSGALPGHRRTVSTESNWNYLNYLNHGAEARDADNEFNHNEGAFQSLLDRFNFLHESVLAIHARLEAAFQQANFYLQNTSEACGKFFALLQVNQNDNLATAIGGKPIAISHPYANLSNLVALSHQKANNSRVLMELQTELVSGCLQRLEQVTLSHQTLFQRIDTRASLRQAMLHYQQKLENLKQSSLNSAKYKRNVKKYESSEGVFTAFNAALIGDLTAAWSSRMLVLGPAFNCWVRVEKSMNELFAATLPNIAAIDEHSEDIQLQLQATQQQAIYNSLIAKHGTQPVRVYETASNTRQRSNSQPDLLRMMSMNSNVATPSHRQSQLNSITKSNTIPAIPQRLSTENKESLMREEEKSQQTSMKTAETFPVDGGLIEAGKSEQGETIPAAAIDRLSSTDVGEHRLERSINKLGTEQDNSVTVSMNELGSQSSQPLLKAHQWQKVITTGNTEKAQLISLAEMNKQNELNDKLNEQNSNLGVTIVSTTTTSEGSDESTYRNAAVFSPGRFNAQQRLLNQPLNTNGTIQEI